MNPSMSTASVLEALDASIALRAAPATTGVNTDAEPLRAAAAVLHVFDPEKLQPYKGVAGQTPPWKLLFDESLPAIGWRRERYRTLKAHIRRAALLRLADRSAMRMALEANPHRERTSLQDLFERWVDGDGFDLLHMSYVQLEELRQLLDWGLEGMPDVPSRAELEAATARRSSVAMFEHLVNRSFVGRARELQKLRNHASVTPPLIAKTQRLLNLTPSPLLIVTGRGGAGKTALIGRFLLENVESGKGLWFPFVYLAFDAETLDIRQPFTLLVEARAQLAVQANRVSSKVAASTFLERAFIDFDASVGIFRDQQKLLHSRATTVRSQTTRLTTSAYVETDLYREFAKLLNTVIAAAEADQGGERVTIVLVFDTFEEVMYRTDEDLQAFWRMLEALYVGCERLRVIICSRATPRSFPLSANPPIALTVGDLAEQDAVLLLAGLGIGDPSLARNIVRQVGRSPLTLRLAARVAADEKLNHGSLTSLATRKFWLRLGPEIIRGQLYRRILDHIHDPDVRALAHPGMVLRRVTAPIIERGLGAICGIGDISAARAEYLFEALRREHTLVRTDGDAIRYRPDVRASMLQLLTRDMPSRVAEIHRWAVDFYRAASDASDDPIERAEELYHRMMLDESADALDRRWMTGVEQSLGNVLDEIPPRAQFWLASRMSIELPTARMEQAELAEWERIVGRKALEGSRYEAPERILEMLAERSDRTADSPLFAIEARVLMRAEQQSRAAALLEDAVAQWPAMGNAGRLAELLWLAAQAAAAGDDEPDSVRFLQELCELSKSLESRKPLVQALTELAAHATFLGPDALAAIRRQLANTLDQLDDADVNSEESLVRLALVRLGPEFPDTLCRLIDPVTRHFHYAIIRRQLVLAPAMGPALELIRGVDRADVAELAAKVGSPGDEAAMEVQLWSGLVDCVKVRPVATPLIAALLKLLECERVTLSGATLAGVEEYRAEFDLQSSPVASV